jgi:formylmethanofuran dehydrogenase subunit C
VVVSATRLRLRGPVTLPVEAACICPDRFAGLGQAEVAALPILHGRRRLALGDLFAVEGDGATDIVISGDLRHVKHIGQGMSAGRVIVDGDAGMHLGAQMCGGEILVRGNVGGWAGAEMRGGVLEIQGNANAKLGAAYPGQKRGMMGGIILVQGNAGPRAGERMRRGLIAIRGDAAEFAGARMIAGSIVVFGMLGARAGAGMKRGTIVALGGLADDILPTFLYACTVQPVFLRLYLRRLQEWGLPVMREQVEGHYRRYSGDITALGKGEILVNDQS